jgi:outer membrane biosynthesis protein TonB
MKLPSTFTKRIIEGYVLDEQGNWVTIDEAVSREQELRAHRQRGEVLIDGKWVPVPETMRHDSQVDDATVFEAEDKVMDLEDLDGGEETVTLRVGKKRGAPRPPDETTGKAQDEASSPRPAEPEKPVRKDTVSDTAESKPKSSDTVIVEVAEEPEREENQNTDSPQVDAAAAAAAPGQNQESCEQDASPKDTSSLEQARAASDQIKALSAAVDDWEISQHRQRKMLILGSALAASVAAAAAVTIKLVLG